MNQADQSRLDGRQVWVWVWLEASSFLQILSGQAGASRAGWCKAGAGSGWKKLALIETEHRVLSQLAVRARRVQGLGFGLARVFLRAFAAGRQVRWPLGASLQFSV